MAKIDPRADYKPLAKVGFKPPYCDDAPTNWKPVATVGLSLIFATFVVFGSWAAIARLDSAAVASGRLSTTGNIRTVQHLEGGIVRMLNVANGSRVSAGDLLIRLDTTQTEASVRLFERQLAAAGATVARLEAEEALSSTLEFPGSVLSLADDAFVGQAIKAETSRFNVGRDALEQQTRIIDAQNDQIMSEIASKQAQSDAARSEMEVVEVRRGELEPLIGRGLVRRNEVLEMERDILALKGTITVAASEINRSRQRIEENRFKVIQFQQQYRQLAANALPELRKEIREIERQKIIASDMLNRVEIRAPVDGVVQELRVFTVGAVVQPGEPLMNIAPEGAEEGLIVRAEVLPLDADSVIVGMAAEVQFPAFSSLNILPINGTVVARSGDRITDQASNLSYFAVDVQIDDGSIPDEIRNRLGAGLPATVVIPTGERTALAYMVDPLFKRLNVAMRER